MYGDEAAGLIHIQGEIEKAMAQLCITECNLPRRKAGSVTELRTLKKRHNLFSCAGFDSIHMHPHRKV